MLRRPEILHTSKKQRPNQQASKWGKEKRDKHAGSGNIPTSSKERRYIGSKRCESPLPEGVSPNLWNL
eukprot:502650-Pelagomonas_calceolata.AAC.2